MAVIDHGSQALMRDALNLSAEGIVREVRERWPHLLAAAATA